MSEQDLPKIGEIWGREIIEGKWLTGEIVAIDKDGDFIVKCNVDYIPSVCWKAISPKKELYNLDSNEKYFYIFKDDPPNPQKKMVPANADNYSEGFLIGRSGLRWL